MQQVIKKDFQDSILFEAGDFLIREGEALACFYIIESGQVEVASQFDKNVALKGPGDLIGESSFILGRPSIVSVKARTQVVASVVSAQQFQRRLSTLAPWARSLVKGLLERIQITNKKAAEEFVRATKVTEEKVRMEKELAIAKLVQETFFPADIYKFGDLEIAGYYQPASECSGDWWHYCEIGSKIFLWIGDATGHGVSAAFITSAARSAASVIGSEPDMSPSRAMQILNKAVYDTSKGKMLMTFFLATYDRFTGEFCYVNASHQAPILLRWETAQTVPRCSFLMDVNSPQLGTASHYKYIETSFKLEQGDVVCLYTDGVKDLVAPNGQCFGEKRFMKSLVKFASEKKHGADIRNNVIADLESFRRKTPLPDDVTLLICKRT